MLIKRKHILTTKQALVSKQTTSLGSLHTFSLLISYKSVLLDINNKH